MKKIISMLRHIGVNMRKNKYLIIFVISSYLILWIDGFNSYRNTSYIKE